MKIAQAEFLNWERLKEEHNTVYFWRSGLLNGSQKCGLIYEDQQATLTVGGKLTYLPVL